MRLLPSIPALNTRQQTLAAGMFWLTIGMCPAAPAGGQTLGSDRLQISGSLSVDRAVQIGLQENLMIRASRADARAMAAETGVARSQTRPQVSANTYLSYGDSPNILSTVGGVMPTNYLTVPQKGLADQNLTLMVPLYTGGRLGQAVQAAMERERAAQADTDGVQADTVLKIKGACYRSLLAVETVRVAQARMDAASEMVRTTQALFAAGKGLESSVRRVEAELADAQRVVTTATNAQVKALLDLKAAMGVRLDSVIALSDPLTYAPPRGDLNSYLTQAGRSRPELRAAQARLASARHQTGATRSAQGAQVYGMAMVDGFTSQPTGTRSGYTVGLVASFPLLDGGQRRSETAAAKAQEERTVAELRDLELRVANEVQQAWLDVETAAQNYRTAQSALQSAQSAYEVTVLRVQNQKSLLVEQLDALAALTQARGNVAQALYDHSIAVAQLERAAASPTSNPPSGSNSGSSTGGK